MGKHHAAATSTFSSSPTSVASSAASATTSSGGFFSSTATCSPYPSPEFDTVPIVGDWTFHHLMIVLAGIFAGIACVISFGLILLHATHLSNPPEQIKIIRVTLLLPAFCLISFGCIFMNLNFVYLKSWVNIYEAIAMCAFLALVCTFISPRRDQQESYFDSLELRSKKGEAVPGGSLTWFKRTWFCVYQYPLVALICAVATDATQAAGVYCLTSNGVHFAHLWLNIVNSFSVAIAVTAIIRFTARMKPEIPEHQVMKKLIGFKAIVFLDFIQTLLFTFLSNHVTVTTKVSYSDLMVGLPSMLICIEIVPISIFFLIAYSWKPYTLGRVSRVVDKYGSPVQGERYQGGFLGIKAIFSALNPMDLLSGITTAFGFFAAARRSKQGSQPLPEDGYPLSQPAKPMYDNRGQDY